MKLSARYRRPVLIAVMLHVLLLIVMIVRLSASAFRAPPVYQPKPFDSIQATAVIPQTITAPTPKPVQPVDHTKEKEEEQQMLAQNAMQEKKTAEVRALKIQAEKLQQNALLQANQLAQQHAREQAREAALKQQSQAALLEKQRIEKQLQQQKQAKLAKLKAEKLKKQKVLTAEQQKLQQAMMQQQLNNEAKNISQVQTQTTQGTIDQYKAQILALIQSNWRIDQVNSQLKCIYSVSLAPDGTVLSVTLVRGSGNSDLDDSARQAIMQSSPLPVPQDSSLFNRFRQLILTLSPQGYLQSVGSA